MDRDKEEPGLVGWFIGYVSCFFAGLAMLAIGSAIGWLLASLFFFS